MKCALGMALGLALLGGCAHRHDVKLQVEPSRRPVVYDQRFHAAHYSVGQDGQYDLVLHNVVAAGKAQKDRPLLPVAGAAPQQFMHIRVSWRPSVGAKANYPAATNAIVDWYVIDDSDPHQPRYLHYQGTGLVKIYPGQRESDFDILPLELSLQHQQGGLSDPLDSAKLSGKLEARRDSGRVKSLLAEFQDSFAAAATQAAEKP